MRNFDPVEYVKAISPNDDEMPGIVERIACLRTECPGAAALLDGIVNALGVPPVKPTSFTVMHRMKVDLPVTDRCNLGCASCSHFAPLARKAPMVPRDEIRESLNLLRTACGEYVGDIYILGGEPLLHPELAGIIFDTSEAMPNAWRCVVTNMLLAMEKLDGLAGVLRDTGTLIGYSCYGEVNRKQVNDGLAKCMSNHIMVTRFGENPSNFTSYMKSVEPRFPITGKFSCPMNGCLTLRGCFLYLCSPVTYLEYPNSAFGMSLLASRFDRINLRDVEHPDEVLALANLPHPFCRHCDVAGNMNIGWRPSLGDRGEWFL